MPDWRGLRERARVLVGFVQVRVRLAFVHLSLNVHI